MLTISTKRWEIWIVDQTAPALTNPVRFSASFLDIGCQPIWHAAFIRSALGSVLKFSCLKILPL